MTQYFEGDPRTNRERMLAGDPYIADDPQQQEEYLTALAATHTVPHRRPVIVILSTA